MSDKAALRRSLREQWQMWTDREAVSRAICEHLTAHLLWRNAQTVFLYLGGLGEVSTAALLADAVNSGKTVALPRCLGGGVMQPLRFEGTLCPDAHGLPAPPDTSMTVSQVDLALVPGLAYDHRGFRLGQGGGYYDRFLSGYDGLSLGLCPEAFLVPELPLDAWDAPVFGLVTERGLSVL